MTTEEKRQAIKESCLKRIHCLDGETPCPLFKLDTLCWAGSADTVERNFKLINAVQNYDRLTEKEKKYTIRVHTGTIETKYGVDAAVVIEDPECPQNNAVKKLKHLLGYTDNDDPESDPPGYYDGDVGAFFEYYGYEDYEIPETIVRRIKMGLA